MRDYLWLTTAGCECVGRYEDEFGSLEVQDRILFKSRLTPNIFALFLLFCHPHFTFEQSLAHVNISGLMPTRAGVFPPMSGDFSPATLMLLTVSKPWSSGRKKSALPLAT